MFKERIMKTTDLNKDNIALDGIDPVAYHIGEPLKGIERYRFALDGVTYLFSSESTLKAFQENPSKYTDSLHGRINGGSSGHANERRNLEEKKSDREANVPIDLMEDGDIEMQNLSDSNK